MVDFVSHICRSVLKIDVNELVFDDCLIGMTYVKDFTIWNRSEMQLVFTFDSKVHRVARDETKGAR